MNREKMTLTKWYGGAIRIPQPAHWGFGAFVGSCVGLVRSVFEDETGNMVRVRFTDHGTASADTAKSMININRHYLDGHFGDMPATSSEQTLTAIMGIIVHEAAHFAFSPPDLKGAVEHILDHTKNLFDRSIAAAVANIVEDIWIEAEVDRRVPALTWMLDAINEVMFTDVEERIGKVRKMTKPSAQMHRVGDFLDCLILAKIQADVDAGPYVKHWFARARTATKMREVADRYTLALEIYEEVMQEIKNQSRSSDEILSSILGMTSDKAQRGHAEDPNGRVGQNNNVGNINRGLARIEEYSTRLLRVDAGDSDVECPASIIVYERSLLLRDAVAADRRYEQLAEIGRQRAVVSHPWGQPMSRGTSIRRIHRIATDSRIFAERMDFGSHKPMQVIILVDCSGSMRGCSNGKRRNIDPASQAAAGAAMALAEARCDVAVYGHTADVTSNEEVVLFRAKGFNEPVDLVAPRLGSVVYEEMSNNRDGYAIAAVAQKFTDPRKRRVLIVISDGAPSGQSYNGRPGKEHSQRMVNKVREEGIEVLGISIEQQAVEPNNFIYGAENNVFNEDPHVVLSIISRLMGL